MRMQEMVDYLESRGFKVSKRYISKETAYEFVIRKDGIFFVDSFTYPERVSDSEKDSLQRYFLDKIISGWNAKFRIDNDKKRNVSVYTPPTIKKVIFNPPATVVLWEDGTKTVVKAQDEDFDAEKGLAMAISKKALGNQGNYCNEIKKWVEKWTNECEYMHIHKKKRVLFKDLGTPTEFTFTIDPNPANIKALKTLKTLSGSSDTFEVHAAAVDAIKKWREELKPNPVQKAYDILVNYRDGDGDTPFDVDELIGYLGEALDE